MSEPATTRGRETRERILLSAARLFHAQGVAATSVDEVLAAAGAGKGQLYRYFASKEELTAAVVDHQLVRYLGPQRERLEGLERWEDLEAYFDDLLAGHREAGLVGGCPVGSLALELTGQDEGLRRRLAEELQGWRASLATGLRRLVARDELRGGTPPEHLAASLLASIQGAYLVSTVEGDPEVMHDALQAALAPLRPRRGPDEATSTPRRY